MTRQVGYKVWAMPGGWIPLQSTGREPDFTSYEKICILNAGEATASVEITIFYADRDPVGSYHLEVAGRRVRHVRFNDLIDPTAIPLETDYGCLVESDQPIVVQMIHQDTRQAANALFSTLAFPVMD